MKLHSFSPAPWTNQSNTSAVIKLLAAVLLFALYTPLIISQSCGMSEAMLPPANCRHGLPHPDCTLSGRSVKCVKVKFHYINNTGSSPTPPSEAYLGNLLEYINQKYKSSKIHFTTNDECLHIGTVDPQYNTGPEFYELLDVVNDEVTSTDPELDYLHGYINI
jgi:hypothetical protein